MMEHALDLIAEASMMAILVTGAILAIAFGAYLCVFMVKDAREEWKK